MTPLPADAASAGAAGAFSCLAVLAMLRWRVHLPHAAPNARSLHDYPVPRVGGLAVWAGMAPLAAAGVAPIPGGGGVWLAIGLVAAVSLYDDMRGLSPAVRLPLQLLAAFLAVRLQLDSALALVLGTLTVAWSANAYNFMDGTDGLAAAMSLVGFAAYAAGATLVGAPAGAYWAVVAATAPFAVVNWPPARMFLGDCGAVPIGFLAAAAGLGEWAAGTWPGWFPVLVFLPFLADASITLARRLARGERVWEAHRSHYYQRWHQLGAGHRGTLARYGALMAGTAGSAVVTLGIEPNAGWIVLAAWCLTLGIVYLRIDYHWRKRC